MSATTGIGLGIALLVLGAGHANAQAAVPDTGYSKSFQCPESLPSKEAREEAVLKFITWAQQAHPEWTLAEGTAYRMELLVSHRCESTLTTIRAQAAASEAAASAPEPVAQPVRDPAPSEDGGYLWRFILLTGAISVVMWWWRGRSGGHRR